MYSLPVCFIICPDKGKRTADSVILAGLGYKFSIIPSGENNQSMVCGDRNVVIISNLKGACLPLNTEKIDNGFSP